MEDLRVGREARWVQKMSFLLQLIWLSSLKACLPAAKLALDDVNNNDDILKDYHINLADKDDEVSFLFSRISPWWLLGFC